MAHFHFVYAQPAPPRCRPDQSEDEDGSLSVLLSGEGTGRGNFTRSYRAQARSNDKWFSLEHNKRYTIVWTAF